MYLSMQKNFRAFTVLAFIVTFTTFLFSFTLRDPSLYFFKYAIHKSDNFFSKGQCGCRQCMTELEDDPWFTERFNQSVHPLMSRRNSLLTDDTYHWWQQLQGHKDPANFSEVVEKLFQVIPDDDDLYKDAGPERCRTCAVVGNSGNLKGSRYGPLIDSSDVIIRMNMAPTSGFEKDVGSRTTHHVMYPESAIDLDNTTSLLLIPFKTLDLQWITSALTTGSINETYVPVQSRIKANKNRVLIYSPAFFKYVSDTWLESKGRYPSTGFLSLLFAVHICDKVSVYGFGADQYGNWHHYWENNYNGGNFRETGVHDADHEYNVTLLLADKHKINIFKGF
ncbi:CMP-N-acetylneuraminate-beta-galactosamide-alpha-2,3-sialyltransferase 1 isoform X1 [Salmo trutta]|uniref:CMP-N-acetylneuraminate-beta-galactosamide-alpha-2,3-sialyltransferase 1 n=1 Tax=Salmo trutta TaxID=8032 RepID=A0A673ZZ65_SALTR|nr:CMP-N-acetylneuraminate-beta-galactosamide-alpha-2,3-sialyltransferase 1-like isoform X1 [Salmo trutta]XP_029591089.1 CMP-N-acetylneuraminate-beta-galactosamide-alpha-2,3-sialyltransferase 1-like isoform X1 [Salmo trutta]XP_029591090.1 CMP-N-acetylneuraminate-beta-galactosamide-alpha-2,3-sialyltransferase 1-like isoform X1 [Salmo trutta]